MAMETTRPTTYPDMAYLATGTGIATPDAAHVGAATADPANVPATGATGWAADEIPPRQWFNWAFKWIAKWIRYFDYMTQQIRVSSTFSTVTAVTGLTGSPAVTITGQSFVNGTVSVVSIFIPYVTGTFDASTVLSIAGAVPIAFRPSNPYARFALSVGITSVAGHSWPASVAIDATNGDLVFEVANATELYYKPDAWPASGTLRMGQCVLQYVI